MGDYRSLSHCCALYSAVGIIFMVWVGIMLIHQPFFVGGIEDVEKSKTSAFGAAGTFFLTFLISIIYLMVDTQVGGFENWASGNVNNSRPTRREYDLVSAVPEYHPDDDEDDHEFASFT
ncbi:expressed unknown protein [Seminavis robusta]|uniref:Uncharacterized protein n=1 Tax=Seminavis robusta TaxID=568900 RepID=A0A9N8DV44_9STRA|nr:expressed unknown protein [Seminavis robusta]|eukprot:Sro383_g131250.1 n/a (119) ;mRNA; f:17596-18115